MMKESRKPNADTNTVLSLGQGYYFFSNSSVYNKPDIYRAILLLLHHPSNIVNELISNNFIDERNAFNKTELTIELIHV